LEAFCEQRSHLTGDLLCFLLGADKSHEPIIGIATVPESPIVWVAGVYGREGPPLLFQTSDFLHFSLFPLSLNGRVDTAIRGIGTSPFSPGVGWNETLFDIGIELAQIDLRQDWPDN
jgi:hypothetical protein